MGAVAVGRQQNTDSRSSRAARRQGPAPETPRQFKDTTRTRYNAIRHGILARSVVLEGEDRQQYEDLRTALGLDLGVVGMVEEMWLDQLVSCYWRQQRILRAESEPDARLELLHRYEVGLRNEMRGIIAEIRETQSLRRRGYPDSEDEALRRERRAQTTARHEKSFWESVQGEFDGPEPAPEPARGAGEETRSVYVSPAMPPPAPGPSPAPAVPVSDADIPVSDAAVRFAMDPPPDYIPRGRVAPTMVRAYVGDREGLMLHREGL